MLLSALPPANPHWLQMVQASDERNECHSYPHRGRERTKSRGMTWGGGWHIPSPCQLSSVLPSLPGSEVPALPPLSLIATLQQVSVCAICLAAGSYVHIDWWAGAHEDPSATYQWVIGEGWVNSEQSVGTSLSPNIWHRENIFYAFFLIFVFFFKPSRFIATVFSRREDGGMCEWACHSCKSIIALNSPWCKCRAPRKRC